MILFRGREAHSRSFAKALSWRVLGSIDTFILSWLFTRNVTAAGAIAGTEVLTKMVLYYFHERAWSAVKWGVQKDEPDASTDADTNTGTNTDTNTGTNTSEANLKRGKMDQ